MDNWISLLLRSGVLLSVFLIVVGVILTFIHNPAYLSQAHLTHGLTHPVTGDVPHHLSEIYQLIVHGHGLGIVALGLIVLLATPVLRVAFSVLTFWYEKDRPFVIFTLIVLSFLLLSLFLGKAE